MDAARTHVVVNVKNDDNSWIYQLDKSLEDNDVWLNRLNKRAGEATLGSQKCTIYRVPRWLRRINPSAYEPRVLSLGPYHYGNPQLKAMKEIKWLYLNRFLRRNPDRSLGDYLKLVAAKEAQTRQVYSEAPHMESKHWVEMMLLDSCFVVEYLLMLWSEPGSESQRFNGSEPGSELDGSEPRSEPQRFDDEVLDPYWTSIPVMAKLQEDMLLLENQLPFFLLKELLNLNSLSSRDSLFLANTVLHAFRYRMPGKLQQSALNNMRDIHHIIHLLYSCTLPGNHATQRNRGTSFQLTETLQVQWLPSAKNLKDAGVVFRKKTKNITSFMDIKFQRGTLEIPELQINSHTILMIRNLIAFEQCHIGILRTTNLVAYVYLMGSVIDTPTDVALLQQHGIINRLGNDNEIARLFNQLWKNAMVHPNNYLSGVFADLQRHCNKTRNKWTASLHHNYCGNPWVIVSVIAAIILFLLTATQTTFAILSYFWPRSS